METLTIGRVLLLRTKTDAELQEIAATFHSTHIFDRDAWVRDAGVELVARAQGRSRRYTYEELRGLSTETRMRLVSETLDDINEVGQPDGRSHM